ncbi:hypothetical protein NL676_017371 [Syzygium grande]|nr:hypothetical protein NL676_017371 [Syzygium grande]
MPDEILSWDKLIREGSFKGWCGLWWRSWCRRPFWRIVSTGRLQCLIRSQREELLSAEEVQVKDVEEDAGGGDVKTAELEEQSLDLSLGQENADNKADEREKEEKVDADREDKTEVGLAEEQGVEKDNDSREEGGFEDVVKSRECKEEEEEQGGQWALDAKNISGEHFLQRCTVTEANEMRVQFELNGGNKRMRTDGSWGSKSLDFNMGMEQVQHWVEKATMGHEAK